MKELIKGVESAVNMLDSVMNASGWTVVFKHDYIDENGKYRQIALVRNDFMLNMSDKLREERRKNSEKLIEKTKEKAAEKKKDIEEILEEKETVKAEEETGEKAEEKSAYDKVEQLINKKMSASKDGKVYLDDTDFQTIIEAIKEEYAGKTTIKDKPQVGANLDLKIQKNRLEKKRQFYSVYWSEYRSAKGNSEPAELPDYLEERNMFDAKA